MGTLWSCTIYIHRKSGCEVLYWALDLLGATLGSISSTTTNGKPEVICKNWKSLDGVNLLKAKQLLNVFHNYRDFSSPRVSPRRSFWGIQSNSLVLDPKVAGIFPLYRHKTCGRQCCDIIGKDTSWGCAKAVSYWEQVVYKL